MNNHPSDYAIAEAQYVARKANALKARYMEALMTDLARKKPLWKAEYAAASQTEVIEPFTFEDLGAFRTAARVESPLLGTGEEVSLD